MLSAVNWLALLFFQLLAYSAIFVGASVLGFGRNSKWLLESSFRKPRFMPSAGQFTVAWMLLYTLSGLAVFLVWQVDDNGSSKWQAALSLWFVQHVCAVGWPVVFFSWRALVASLVLLAVIWSLSIATLVLFYIERAVAGGIFTIYQLWLTFAFIVQLFVVIHNSNAPNNNLSSKIRSGIQVATDDGKMFSS